MLHRVLSYDLSTLGSHRYAEGRARGTEMHLPELSDFATERYADGQFASSSTLDFNWVGTPPFRQLWILIYSGFNSSTLGLR